MRSLSAPVAILLLVMGLVWVSARSLGGSDQVVRESPMERAQRALSAGERHAAAATNALKAANYGDVATELEGLRGDLVALRAHLANIDP